MTQSLVWKRLQPRSDRLLGDNASNKTALLAAQQKDEKSSEMITELTAVSNIIKIL